MPHSTQVAGYAAIHGGDDRHVGNIFLGGDAALAYGPTSRLGQRPDHGTAGYDGHPASMEDYLALVADPTRGDHERFMDVKQPVYIRDNVYAAGAEPFEAEKGAIVLTGSDVTARSSTKAAQVYLETRLPVAFDNVRVGSRQRSRPRTASASSTPTSRSPTAPRPSWPPTWSASKEPVQHLPRRPDHRPRLRPSRIRVW